LAGGVIEVNSLKHLLGSFPEKAQLQPTELEVEDCGAYLRQKVAYNSEVNDRIPAYLLIPKERKGPLPAIYCHHQHGGNYSLGKSEVAGLLGDPDLAYASELAQRGFITLAPDALGFEERNKDGGKGVYFELASRLVQGKTLLAKVLHDVFAGIDYLESRTEVDASRIGFIGHSYGGRMAIWTPALDKRIRASVSNCGCINYKDSLEVGIQMEFCVPNIMKEGDVEDVVRLVEPTPLYISATRDDQWSRGAEKFRPQEGLQLKIWPGGHIFSKPMREEAYSFLEKYLLF
jgi:dienelactone hydrolase